MSDRHHVAVVGGGIVGLSTARTLTRRHPALRIVVVEKETAVGTHQTAHSSGVIHRGVYYTPGSLKARLCVEGAERLVSHCEERNIPVNRCGKVVVAVEPEELPLLDELYRRAVANRVPGVEMIERERLRELEPHVAGLRAVHSPSTFTVDFRLVADSFADDVRAAGGEIECRREVRDVGRVGRDTVLRTSEGPLVAKHCVVCAGLQSDRVGVSSGAPREPRIVPFRGDYLRLREERRFLSRGLVYPVPDPTFPFLGVHTTVRPDGDVWLGPNAVLAFSREGYARRSIRPRDLRDALAAPGFRRLARAHWRVGAGEMMRDLSARLFVRAARRLIPELRHEDVLPGPSGVRAQALAPDGGLVDDFVIQEVDGVVHVRNAPSPGATSSLAIADHIVDTLERAWDIPAA